MNGWEITCVIIGILMICSSGSIFNKSESIGHFFKAIIYTIFEDVIGALMILLPLYFNYWRM